MLLVKPRVRNVDVSNTFVGKVFENDQFNDIYESNYSKESFSNQGQPISKSSLIVKQKRNPKILPLFQKAVDDIFLVIWSINADMGTT